MTRELLVAIAAHGLAASPSASRQPRPFVLDHDAVDALLAEIVAQRLVGALAAAVRDGAIELTPAAVDLVAEFHEGWCQHVLRLERLLLDTTAAFESAGIAYRAFKGAALAHRWYPDASERIYVDVDLLVPSESFGAAATLVENLHDGRRLVVEPRRGHDRSFGKEITVRVRDVEIDLHRTFVAGPLGFTVDLADLFAHGDTVELGGQRVDVLDPLHQFVHACLNAAVGDRPTRLQSLRDVAIGARAIEPEPAAVEALARRWRCLAAVKQALCETYRVLRLEPTPLSRWADEVRPSTIDRWLLRAYSSPGRSYTRPLAAAVVIAGVRPRVRYLGALVWPSDDYLRSRGWSRTHHVGRAVRSLVGRR